MIQTVILSPIPALRVGLRALLAGDPEIAVAAALASLDDLAAPPGEAGVLIVTAGALDEDALETLAAWAVLWIGDDLEEARVLFERPAWGLLAPDATPEALQAAVRALAEGLSVASAELMQQALALTPRQALPLSPALEEGAEPPEALTGREVDVLRLAAQGLTNKQIALSLGISEHTVKFHVSAIFAKLGVSNRAEAVRNGARWGWVPL